LESSGTPVIKATPKELYGALHGWLTEHHRFLLRLHPGRHDVLDAAIRALDERIEAQIAHMRRSRLARSCSVP